ncbi:MAG: hypothetical protein Q7U80_05185 [Thiobacillus sp.]|nr:hypothetical protein [Gammaproteobacteria bacterium]MBU4498633.1 hypothetical protein [Gammaproteobacteria bacterium]MDO9007597.1 hypothetical protein [Thiobacillus sp.]MDP2028082.1 hypothetical protein [Thiobacillus sp.]MDP3124861.1 hypothetical protein [Thiobacillus sp.]
MRTAHSASILVAALVMLRHPCSRNKATARFLLERAAEHSELTPAERDACRSLADELDNDPADFTTAHPSRPVQPPPPGCRMLGDNLEMHCCNPAPNLAARNALSLLKTD